MPIVDDESLIDLFRQCRLRATGQRLAIMKTLMESKSHLSADELYQKLKSSHPTLSMSTVYKTLQMMAQIGAVMTIETGPGCQKFDAGSRPHHHAICSSCGRIIDVDFNTYPVPLNKDNLIPGFMVQKVKVYFNGLCEDCAKEKRKSKNTSNRSGTFA
jgi:Fur family peroxide stress response transcriptional regulator